MAESLGNGPDDSVSNGKSEASAAKPHDLNLPMIVAPKLGAAEDEAMDEAADATADETAAAAAPVRSTRFLIIAASVAFAAAFGSFVGSVSGSGFAQFLYPAAPGSGTENGSEAVRAMKLELAELATLKANLDTATRNATSQYAKIADRLDRLGPHTSVATETTGSIANAQPVAGPPKQTDRILEGWVVQDVQNGRALIESRYGGVFDVGAGSVLPGVGRVDTITRQDGQWVVLTARGTITSGR